MQNTTAGDSRTRLQDGGGHLQLGATLLRHSCIPKRRLRWTLEARLRRLQEDLQEDLVDHPGFTPIHQWGPTCW